MAHFHVLCNLCETSLTGACTSWYGWEGLWDSLCLRITSSNNRLPCMQTCRWEFLVFSGTFDTHLTVEEDKPAGRVVFNLVSSAFMRSFQGRWQVQGLLPLSCLPLFKQCCSSAVGSWAERGVWVLKVECDVQVQEVPGRGCRVEHRLSVQPVVAPPEAFSGYTQKIFERQVEQLLKDLGQELCRVQRR